ncbi:hypothetical protein ACHAXN_006350 [Cyclotella atomus]
MRPSHLYALSWVIIANDAFASTPRRRKSRRRQIKPVSTKLSANKETLRDRWIDVLNSSYDAKNAIRLENRLEEEHYVSAERLADQLLTGLDVHHKLLVDSRQYSPISKVWESIAIGSTGLLLLGPLVMLFVEVLPPNFLSSSVGYITLKLGTFHTSITPYLVPTIETIQASIKDQVIQAQSIIASLPYLLKHARRIELVPLAIKLVRKCIILEAWRHIWIRFYKISKRVWKGTRVGSVKVYTKFVPAWIRRGISSTFKSMVQAQVHGVVGGAIGGIYSSFMGDGMESVMDETPAEGALDGVIESTIDVSVDVVGEKMVDALESVVESGAASTVVDAIAESVSSSFDEISDAIFTDGLTSAIEESVETAANAVSESLDSVMDEVFEGIE